jgi:hypothetical protein
MYSKNGPKFQRSWIRTSISASMPATKAEVSLVRLLLTIRGTDGLVFLINDALEITCIASSFAAQGAAELETMANLCPSSWNLNCCCPKPIHGIDSLLHRMQGGVTPSHYGIIQFIAIFPSMLDMLVLPFSSASDMRHNHDYGVRQP